MFSLVSYQTPQSNKHTEQIKESDKEIVTKQKYNDIKYPVSKNKLS